MRCPRAAAIDDTPLEATTGASSATKGKDAPWKFKLSKSRGLQIDVFVCLGVYVLLWNWSGNICFYLLLHTSLVS